LFPAPRPFSGESTMMVNVSARPLPRRLLLVLALLAVPALPATVRAQDAVPPANAAPADPAPATPDAAPLDDDDMHGRSKRAAHGDVGSDDLHDAVARAKQKKAQSDTEKSTKNI
jgi:hypothetical protein